MQNAEHDEEKLPNVTVSVRCCCEAPPGTRGIQKFDNDSCTVYCLKQYDTIACVYRAVKS